MVISDEIISDKYSNKKIILTATPSDMKTDDQPLKTIANLISNIITHLDHLSITNHKGNNNLPIFPLKQ